MEPNLDSEDEEDVGERKAGVPDAWAMLFARNGRPAERCSRSQLLRRWLLLDRVALPWRLSTRVPRTTRVGGPAELRAAEECMEEDAGAPEPAAEAEVVAAAGAKEELVAAAANRAGPA